MKKSEDVKLPKKRTKGQIAWSIVSLVFGLTAVILSVINLVVHYT